jgi:serine/threonine protein kinase
MMPKTAGPWKLGEQIGKGGQGRVFAATRDEGTLAAVKLINLSRPKKRARFIQEVKLHARLSDEQALNIIPVLDHNLEEIEAPENSVRGYIAMPKAVCSLDDILPLLNLRTELCLETFLGIVNGIKNAHLAGAVHRDIKPANVLFLDHSYKEPMVSDFGVCFLKETIDDGRLTEPGETVGARFFMAPEQERGDVTDVSESADVYALGKLLHFMIASRRLYREKLSESFAEVEVRQDERLAVVRDQLLAGMIIENPVQRIQSADEVFKITSEILNSFRNRS